MRPIGEVARIVVDHAATLISVRAKLAGLDQHNAPLDVPLARWRSLLRDSRDFIDSQLALLALELGWDLVSLWGCDAARPFSRIDHAGLLWLVNGAAIVDLDENHCALSTPSIYRRRSMPAGEVVLAWELR
jgi:hypothetical protein